jgi:hypothetical protein
LVKQITGAWVASTQEEPEMIDQTKLTMGLTVEELEKLEALDNQFCKVSALPDKFDNVPKQDPVLQSPDGLAVVKFG